ncbi:methyltransferase, FxLD system [Streptomyces sp. SID13031]|uniref:methyltransferase, FxLD system n=1 Tax=Streptomyces sp. SID13031 TaxID=2706046 RepID=UPI0013CDCB48|nr:methyltransferase, FxLD system [Streptomyces sp. SID13031]NEA30381.1 methyltransferase, FxLD system [Streptomyces sp. SID13031]
MDAESNDSPYAGTLRAALTDLLVSQDAIHDERIAAAFRVVPRHLFVPLVPLELAYTDDVVLMKRNESGIAISSVSQPTVVALMLEQADIQAGHRVLEIGSGGYNAALLRELVGPTGEVTTIDIDPDVTTRARQGLDAAGYPDVRVLRTDGEFGVPESAPYDRVLVTVTAWDIPTAWLNQLAPGGRIVVPLRFRSQTRSIAFDLLDAGSPEVRLESRSMTVCGFVDMQGAGANEERYVSLHRGLVSLSFDEDQQSEPIPPERVLDQPKATVWSGVLMNREEPLSDLDLWLATTLPGYCVLSAEPRALKKGIVAPVPRWGASAMASADSLGYLTARPAPDPDFVELGANAHGPAAQDFARLLADQVSSWNANLRGGPGPSVQIHPGDYPTEQLPPGLHLRKRHNQLTLSWPAG